EIPYIVNAFESTCPSAQINAVVIHDSFFNDVDPWFGDNFHKAVYASTLFYPHLVRQLIDEVKPNVVIEEAVQRYLSIAPVPSPDSTIGSIMGFDTFKTLTNRLTPDHFVTDLSRYQVYAATAQIKGDALSLRAISNDPQIIFSVP